MQSNEDLELIEYIPKACEGDAERPARYLGKIILSMPNFEQRIGILEKLGSVEQATEAEIAEAATGPEKMKIAAKNMRAIIMCLELARPYIHEVKIKRISDSREYKTIEALSRNKDFDVDMPQFVQILAQSGILEEKPTPS